MKITEFDWNSFYVVFPLQKGEASPDYLRRALECLTQFNNTHSTMQPPINPFWMLMGELELLMEEQNFCDMYLEKFCDVKYKVSLGIAPLPAGILVYSHRIEDRRPQVDFLKQRWKEFSYDTNTE